MKKSGKKIFFILSVVLLGAFLQSDAKSKKKSSDVKGLFKYTMNDVLDYLVIITCDGVNGKSSGSGFVAKMDGKTYLFTNQHVVMGTDSISFKTVSGKVLRPRQVELSTTRDVVRLLLDESDGFEIMDKVKMDMPVGVFGNSEGGGVATELFGRVTGIGADVIEVSAKFVSGNSGSPVLGLNKKVIGIASYVRVPTPTKVNKGTKFEKKTRRFCFRITGNTWKVVNWRMYNEKYGKVYLKHEMFLNDLLFVLGNWYEEPLKSIPIGSVKSRLLTIWVKTHNNFLTVGKRKDSRSTFLKHYAASIEKLEKFCRHEISQIKKFKRNRQLTGFLRKEAEKQIYLLESICETCRAIENYVLGHR